jgi:hypothetical protein
MEETMARWVRVEAARRDLSVSRFLADLVRIQMLSERRYRQSLRSALARKPCLRSDGRYLAREELHERTRVR